MKQIPLTKKVISLVLCFVMTVGVLPMTASASDTFPGKPDDMKVSGSSYEKIGENVIWCCPNSGGSIQNKTSGEGYVVYEAAPGGGYAFSHWATYYVRDKWYESYEHENPYDVDVGSYAFSKPGTSGKDYNPYDSTIQVNTNTSDSGRFYLYAVFVPGVSVSATVENGGAIFDARNLDNYITIDGEYESYAKGAETAHFGVAQRSDLSISFITDLYTSIERVVIDNQDRTSAYNNDIKKSQGREYLTLVFRPVTEKIVVQLVTKPRECVIHFHPNADNAGGSMVNQTFQNGTAQALTKNAFANEGYMFSSWNTQSDGSGTTYKDGESVTLRTSSYEMDLYAQWKKPLGAFIVPTANDLTYNGAEQELVSAGSSTEGTMMYRLGTSGEFSTVIPKAAFAGEYTVYYYVKGSGDFADSEVQSIPVTIKKLLPTVDMFTSAPIGTGKQTTVTVKPGITGMGSVTVEYYSGEQKLDGIPTKPGTYTVRINVAAGDNYTAATGLTTEDWGFAISEEDAQAYLCSISEPDYRDGECYWFKSGNAATITAPQGYTISKDPNGTFSDSVALSQGDEKKIYLRSASGNTIYPVDLSEKIAFYESYTITFDANGGTLKGDSSTEVTPAGTIALPTDPTRSGSYSFKGWYTAASGGIEVTTSTVFDTDATIYAQWTYTGSSGGGGASTYAITVKDAKNGEVTSSHKSASAGTTVTLTVEADKGYTLETLTVTNGSGKEVKVTEKDGKYTFKMPNSKVTVEATFMDDNTMLNYFVDVPADAYYYDAVLWAAEESITSGTDAVHFSPNAACTRAQAVTFLWRAAGSPEPESSEMPFEDVAADAYYYDAVLWAVENGITAGTTTTTFAPNATCTRAQIVTFLWRSQKSPAAESVSPFTDVAAGAYYSDAVLWAVENGVTAGTTAAIFSPNNNCTRAQIVTFLYRCMEK